MSKILKIKTKIKNMLNKPSLFEITSDTANVYDNRSGELLKVGTLKQGQVFVELSDYGNWHKIQFADFFGYIKKTQTNYVKSQKSKFKKNKIMNSSINQFFYTLTDANIYSEKNLLNVKGVLCPGVKYPILGEGDSYWVVEIANDYGFIKKTDVILKKEENIRTLLMKAKSINRLEELNRIRPFLISYSNNYKDSADKIMNDKIVIKGHAEINIKKGIPWENTKDYPRSFHRLLHGHYFINDLVETYRELHNKDYIEKGYLIIEDWINKHPYKENANNANVMAWHDETTSKRLKTWVNFMDVALDVLDEGKLNFLMKNLINHADILSTQEFYSKNTNHGMFQDESLLVFCSYFSYMTNHAFYYSTACNRLKEYFDFIISKEGVHLEHSPIYHFIIARMIKKLSVFFKELSDEEKNKYYESLYMKMASYATFVLKPDGTLPGIGDSFNGIKGFTDLWTDNMQYKYALTSGKDGKAPFSSAAFYEDAGYAIIRDDWKNKEQSTYIHFTGAYHTAYHKHSDDLSIWLYANGQDIVTEAGPNGYDYNNDFTKYGYSSFAHNTLIVNNKGLPRVDKKFSDTYLFNYTSENGLTTVSGINKRFKEVDHTRELKFNKSSRNLKVKDLISPKMAKPNNYKILWHFAEGIIPKIDGNQVCLFKGNKQLLKMDIHATSSFKLNLVFGQKKPFLLGWHIKKKDNVVETSTLVVEIEESKMEEDVIIYTNFKISN